MSCSVWLKCMLVTWRSRRLGLCHRLRYCTVPDGWMFLPSSEGICQGTGNLSLIGSPILCSCLNLEQYFNPDRIHAGIAKLDDANDAGTRFSGDCTLILTEGDSAKALAVAGLSVVGRNRYGVFPLRCACSSCCIRAQCTCTYQG